MDGHLKSHASRFGTIRIVDEECGPYAFGKNMNQEV